MDAQQIGQVRRFNRIVSQRIGALDESYLARGRPLWQARILFEVGPGDGIDLGTLRLRLGLDSGYLSRLLRALEAQRLIELGRNPADGRGRRVRLTEAGRAEWAVYDSLSDRLAASLLAPHEAGRRARLLAAMAEVEALLRSGAVALSPEPPDSEDARWCLNQYFAELAERFDAGFDAAREGRFTGADMTPPAGYLVLARSDGAAVGCGALKRLAPDIGEIKRVWIAPSMRGKGIATRLMDELEALARQAGFRTVRLDTNRALTEAQALYRKRGYREIERYNDNPYAHHWFEKPLDP